MPSVSRRVLAIASLIVSSAGWAPALAQVPKPVPGSAYQHWDVLEADGGARKVYFRNDTTLPITITQLVIQRCENTRQTCGTYPANVTVAPGKTAVAFRVERLDAKLGWSFAYSFHTHLEGGAPMMMSGPPPGAMIRGPNGGPAVMLQSVAVDSIPTAVTAFTEGASCGKVMVPDLPAGHRALMMVFGTATQPAARRVMVRLDASGAAYDFVDTRRDPEDSGADPLQTQVTLDLVRQTVMVRNSGGAVPATMFRASGPTLLTAASLGKPGEMIARLVRECATP